MKIVPYNSNTVVGVEVEVDGNGRCRLTGGSSRGAQTWLHRLPIRRDVEGIRGHAS